MLSVVTALSLFLLTAIYKRIQGLMWRINGVCAARAAAAQLANYDHCVHVQRVISRVKLSQFLASSDFDFLTVHERFVNPNTLLQPSISLYTLTTSEAIFVQTTKQVNINSTATHPFMKWAQANNADRILTMSIEAFHQLADEIGDPRIPVILLSSIGRCGSTLLQNVFENVPGTVVLGEPDALSISRLERTAALFSRDEKFALLRSSLRLLCKARPDVQRFVIKGKSAEFGVLEDVRTLFPTVKHVFLHRYTIPHIKSTKAMFQSDAFVRIWSFLADSDIIAQLFPRIRKELCTRYANDTKALDVSHTICSAGIFCAKMAIIYNKYSQLVESGFPIFSVLYEDMINHKEEIIREIFSRLDIDEGHVQTALGAFTLDSQEGSSLSRKATGKRKTLSAREICDMNRVLELYNLPECPCLINLPVRILPRPD